MTDTTLRFAIFGNEYQTTKTDSIENLLSVLRHYRASIYIDNPFLDFLESEEIDVEGVNRLADNELEVDFVISMGGDGTFLKAAAKVGQRDIPIIGVNIGRLGFLADIMPEEIEQAVSSIYNGEYKLEKHAVVEVEIDDLESGDTEHNFALNDIAILKRDTAAMVTIHASIDDEYLVTYQADGLVVSTPTGSTAYNLSNGGPIMVTSADILCLTPVAPHSLNIRPIVINGNSVVTLSVESRSHNFLVAVDGRSRTLSESSKVRIRKAPHNISIVKLKNKNFYTTLREKLMWGLDNRG